jgi:hypothetical protein
VKPDDVRKWLAPIEELFTTEFWRGSERGLAVFRTGDSFHAFFAPYPVESRVIVGRRFFLKPLIPSLIDARAYYILAISDNRARLFRCRYAECTELPSDKLPTGIGEALASKDFSQRLQGHSSRASARKVLTYHGHSAPVEEIHENRQTYCRMLSNAVQEIIGNSTDPFVVACVKELFIEFKKVAKHFNLIDKAILGNPDRLSPVELHDAAQQIVDADTQKRVEQAAAEYAELRNTDRATTNVEVILEALSEGRVKTAFVARDAEVWATLDQSINPAKVAIGAQSPEREEFLNIIAIETLMQNGSIYTLPLASMPSGKPAAAVFRYLAAFVRLQEI